MRDRKNYWRRNEEDMEREKKMVNGETGRYGWKRRQELPGGNGEWRDRKELVEAMEEEIVNGGIGRKG